jgi:hypothetical protein
LLAWLLLPADTDPPDELDEPVVPDELDPDELDEEEPEEPEEPDEPVEPELELLVAALVCAACCTNKPRLTTLAATTAPTATWTLDINPLLFMVQPCVRGLDRPSGFAVGILWMMTR